MLLDVNGRSRYFEHLSNLERVTRSTWTVERAGRVYRIEGGKHAGGTRREWFVDGGGFTGSINCTSLMDALRMLDTM
jgi:hypothetical protein